MPIRDKAEVSVLPMIAGKLRWSMGQVMGAEGMDEEQFWDACDFTSELFVAVVQAIDWNRALLEAGSMCSQREEEDPDHKPFARGIYVDTHGDENMNMKMDFCPDCLRYVLLRMKKHEVLAKDEDIEMPDDTPPKGFKLNRKMALEMIDWIKRRKESWKEGT